MANKLLQRKRRLKDAAYSANTLHDNPDRPTRKSSASIPRHIGPYALGSVEGRTDVHWVGADGDFVLDLDYFFGSDTGALTYSYVVPLTADGVSGNAFEGADSANEVTISGSTMTIVPSAIDVNGRGTLWITATDSDSLTLTLTFTWRVWQTHPNPTP